MQKAQEDRVNKKETKQFIKDLSRGKVRGYRAHIFFHRFREKMKDHKRYDKAERASNKIKHHEDL